jgi:trimethylamine:corrinoid methyltransferase-like protein
MVLQTAAMVVMGKFYGFLPNGAGFTSDAKQAGAEGVMEKLITTLPSVLAGADIVVGFGDMKSDRLLVLEQIVVDHEVVHILRRLGDGVDCSAAKYLFDDIAGSGWVGTF